MGGGPPSEEDVAVVKPVVNARSPKLGPIAIMVSPKPDLNYCRDYLYQQKDKFFRLFLSRLYYASTKKNYPSLVGPMVGAPYATMILESLIAWGCRQVLFFGWCGSISDKVRTGDIVIPTEAIIDEGTSRHYLGENAQSVRPATKLVDALTQTFNKSGIETHNSPVWTTDGVYRETKSKILHHQGQGIVGVEMELSALLSVGTYRSVEVAGVLVVSDGLSTLTWQPGFKSPEFKKGRKAALRGLLDCTQGPGFLVQ